MIYLDNAATTKVLSFGENEPFFANASSPHALGIAAARALENARHEISEILCRPGTALTFTSGGTESNNLAVLGFANAHIKQKPMLMAEPWAHPSVLAPVGYAAERGMAEAVIAPIGEWAARACKDRPVLACLSQVGHETGDKPPAIATIKKDIPNAVIFTDGAQGFCKEADGASVYAASDIYTFSGHKCHGPTGIGGLAVGAGIRLAPLFHGGGQENALRPGTENVAAAVRLAQSARYLHTHCDAFAAHAAGLRARFTDWPDIPGARVNALTPNPSPYIVNLSFPGARGEVLVHMLSERGIYVSTGAACKSRNKKDKSALARMGFPREISESALRVSFSHRTTPEEIITLKKALAVCVAQLRKISGWRDRP